MHKTTTADISQHRLTPRVRRRFKKA